MNQLAQEIVGYSWYKRKAKCFNKHLISEVYLWILAQNFFFRILNRLIRISSSWLATLLSNWLSESTKASCQMWMSHFINSSWSPVCLKCKPRNMGQGVVSQFISLHWHGSIDLPVSCFTAAPTTRTVIYWRLKWIAKNSDMHTHFNVVQLNFQKKKKISLNGQRFPMTWHRGNLSCNQHPQRAAVGNKISANQTKLDVHMLPPWMQIATYEDMGGNWKLN